ncbi:hypothetical protein GCM10009429_01790 [Dyella marensis]
MLIRDEAMSSTAVLGREFDDSLRTDLKTVLSELGATFGPVRWGAGGSQQVESMSVQVRGQSLLVEAETYVGLSITGPEELVAEVESMIKAKRA